MGAVNTCSQEGKYFSENLFLRSEFLVWLHHALAASLLPSCYSLHPDDPVGEPTAEAADTILWAPPKQEVTMPVEILLAESSGSILSSSSQAGLLWQICKMLHRKRYYLNPHPTATAMQMAQLHTSLINLDRDARPMEVSGTLVCWLKTLESFWSWCRQPHILLEAPAVTQPPTTTTLYTIKS